MLGVHGVDVLLLVVQEGVQDHVSVVVMDLRLIQYFKTATHNLVQNVSKNIFLRVNFNFLFVGFMNHCTFFVIPTAATWGIWGSWGSCSRTCQTGQRQRNRQCLNGNTCPGLASQTQDCNADVVCQRKYTKS